MNTLGRRGIYPIDQRLPGEQRLRVGGGAGMEVGGKRSETGSSEAFNKFEDDSSSM